MNINTHNQLSYQIFNASLAFEKILQGHSLEYLDSWIKKDMLIYRASIISHTKQAIRDYGSTSYILNQLANNKKLHTKIKALLHISISLLLQNNIAIYTIINQSVNACKMHKHMFYASGLVNAILRKIISVDILEQIKKLNLTYIPTWWLDNINFKNINTINIDKNIYLEQIQKKPNMGLRVNPLKTTREEYLNLLHQNNIEAYIYENPAFDTPWAITLPQAIAVEKLPHFYAGYVSVQDVAAQLSPQLLALKDGMKILDACSAPGGKILSCLEQYKLDVSVMDINELRLKKIGENIERLQLKNQLIKYKEYINNAINLDWWDKQEFDIVIADVPCSSSGIVRKQPEIALLRTTEDVNKLQQIQQQILDNLWQTVKKSGILLYITCSIFDKENMQQINIFLNKHKNAQPIQQDKTGQIMVSDNHDGFFYFLLQKTN